MHIDFTTPLRTLKGTPLTEQGQPVRIGSVLSNIIAALPTDTGVPPSERRKRFVLSVRIMQAADAIDIDEADTALTLGLLNASALPPLYSEQIACALEGRPNPLEPRA